MTGGVRGDHLLIGVAAMVSSAVYIYWIWSTPLGACVVGAGEDYENTVEFLNSAIELGLTLGTGLVGLGAALLIGTYGSLRLTPYTIVIVALAIFATAQSVAYGIWWKFGVANLWFNHCLESIDSPALQARYAAHFYLLIAGILLLGIMVLWVAVNRLREPTQGQENAQGDI